MVWVEGVAGVAQARVDLEVDKLLVMVVLWAFGLVGRDRWRVTRYRRKTFDS